MKPARSWLRQIGLVLALFAVSLQAALPRGFMIGGAAGAPALVLCSDQGASVALADLPAELRALLDHGDHDNKSKGGEHCGFAALSIALDAPAHATVLAAPRVLLSADFERPAEPSRVWRAGPPLQARGPPQTV